MKPTGRQRLADLRATLEIAGAPEALDLLTGIETGRESGARGRLREVLALLSQPAEDRVAERTAARLLIAELVGAVVVELPNRPTCVRRVVSVVTQVAQVAAREVSPGPATAPAAGVPFNRAHSPAEILAWHRQGVLHAELLGVGLYLGYYREAILHTDCPVCEAHLGERCYGRRWDNRKVVRRYLHAERERAYFAHCLPPAIAAVTTESALKAWAEAFPCYSVDVVNAVAQRPSMIPQLALQLRQEHRDAFLAAMDKVLPGEQAGLRGGQSP